MKNNPSGPYLGIYFGGGEAEGRAWGSGGVAPSGGPGGEAPWWGVRGAKPPGKFLRSRVKKRKRKSVGN